MSDSLSDYVNSLRQEGEVHSSGSFSLVAQRVTERYQTLLQAHPWLPWMRWLQLGYQVQTRRVCCQLLRDEYRLSLTGCEFLDELQEAVQEYPAVPTGRSRLLQEVLWLFLAQQPQRIQLLTKHPSGHIWLELHQDQLRREIRPQRLEDELQLSVFPRRNWLDFLRLADLKLNSEIHLQFGLQKASYPAGLEWDGSERDPRAWIPQQLPELTLLTQVDPKMKGKIPHFFGPEESLLESRWRYFAQENRLEEGAGFGWSVLEGPSDSKKSRLLMHYSPQGGWARFYPFVNGVRLPAHPLEDWPMGITLYAACPEEISCDYSGLKLVSDEHLKHWLEHLHQRYQKRLNQMVTDFPATTRALNPLLQAFNSHESGPVPTN